jgi:hypothetical protein
MTAFSGDTSTHQIGARTPTGRRRRHTSAQHANYEATIHCATMSKLMAPRTGLTPNPAIVPKAFKQC